MRLRTKFLITIGTIITIAFGFTFYRTHLFQNAIIYEQAGRQARLLTQQILLTRKWVSDHNGVFLLMQPGMEINPFLDNPTMTDSFGNLYIKVNPATVTRQLSLYADREGLAHFRVTSLEPINPVNEPDDFEKAALREFQQGATESSAIVDTESGRVLRYMRPLNIQQSCLECHARHGYELNDLRGGFSLSIPLGWADKKAATNLRLLVGVGIASIILVCVTLLILIEHTVVRRLHLLTGFFATFPEKTQSIKNFTRNGDEISELGKNVIELGDRLLNSQQKLEAARQRIFQAEKLAALGRLSAGVAHEINNPLGGMRNCVKSMKENPDGAEMRARYLDLLDKGLRRIETTIRQLLNFGRREPLSLRLAVVDDIISETLLLLDYRLKNIVQVLDLNLTTPVMIDVEALKQVVMNMLLNGIHAMPEGGTFTIRTRHENNTMILSFRDTGAGIAPEIIDKIFDPFFTTKKVGEGTGMGLAVSYSLIERMGGVIEVTSLLDHGTEFTVKIPINIAGEQ